MSLVAGTVTVNSDATFSGDGLAIDLMNAKVAVFDPRATFANPAPPPQPPTITPPLATQVAVLSGYAVEVNAQATAITLWLLAGGYT